MGFWSPPGLSGEQRAGKAGGILSTHFISSYKTWQGTVTAGKPNFHELVAGPMVLARIWVSVQGESDGSTVIFHKVADLTRFSALTP